MQSFRVFDLANHVNPRIKGFLMEQAAVFVGCDSAAQLQRALGQDHFAVVVVDDMDNIHGFAGGPNTTTETAALRFSVVAEGSPLSVIRNMLADNAIDVVGEEGRVIVHGHSDDAETLTRANWPAEELVPIEA